MDEAVNKVRELWEHPVEVVGKSNPAITDMLAAADQTTAWLKELGSGSTVAKMPTSGPLIAARKNSSSWRLRAMMNAASAPAARYALLRRTTSSMRCSA